MEWYWIALIAIGGWFVFGLLAMIIGLLCLGKPEDEEERVVAFVLCPLWGPIALYSMLVMLLSDDICHNGL